MFLKNAFESVKVDLCHTCATIFCPSHALLFRLKNLSLTIILHQVTALRAVHKRGHVLYSGPGYLGVLIPPPNLFVRSYTAWIIDLCIDCLSLYVRHIYHTRTNGTT